MPSSLPADLPLISFLLYLAIHLHDLFNPDHDQNVLNQKNTSHVGKSPLYGQKVWPNGTGQHFDDDIMAILLALETESADEEEEEERKEEKEKEEALVSANANATTMAMPDQGKGNVSSVSMSMSTQPSSSSPFNPNASANAPIPSISTTSLSSNNDGDFRLADWLYPLKYELRLTLDSGTNIVQGQVQIELECRRPTSLIRLNIAPDFVQIIHALLEWRHSNVNGPPVSVPFRSISLDWKREQLSLWLFVPLQQGNVYYLCIWFNSHYSTDGRGLTRRSKQQERGAVWMNTLFEPSFARRLFPCWDEPHFRSSFRLELWLQNELASGEDYVALSGTRAHCRQWHANLTICQFEWSPPIPTYIFSLAIGPFRNICQNSHGENKEICIWRLAEGRRAEGEGGEITGEEEEMEWDERAAREQVIPAMAKFQRGMEEYLAMDPAAQLHLLIVPMKINGMENFGMLNVRESLWPIPNVKTISGRSTSEQQNAQQKAIERFEKTLFHEMAHQWFGNLVTIDWWDSIWLAESISTFLSSPRPIVFDPSTDLSENAIVDAKWAMNGWNNGNGKGNAGAIPGIVYTKGAALMEMLDALIGAHQMRKLLRQFVRLHQFKSAKTQDFLDLLERTMMMADELAEGEAFPSPASPSKMAGNASSMFVHFMDRWLHLPSHPIVFVDFDAELGQVCFSQTPKMMVNADDGMDRRGKGGGGGKEEEEGKERHWHWHWQRWPIPIWVECAQETNPSEQLLWIPDNDNGQLVVPLDGLTKTNSFASLIFNRNRSVYYQLSIRAAGKNPQNWHTANEPND